ncbi:MAG: hypothetical protein IJU28_02685 [Clostridia bacterium]|nr:hypothetical protein [Clostridia bacterium]
MDLAALWNYMQIDMEAEKFSNDMRNSEKRKKLLKQTEFLKEQQARFAKIENEITSMDQKSAEYRQESERLNKLLEEMTEKLGDVSAMTSEEVEEKLKSAEKLLNAYENCEAELAKLRSEADTAERTQIEIKRRAAKVKSEYDEIKKLYDVEFANDKLKLKELRDNVEKEAEKLDKGDLERYKAIKQHCNPPIAKLVNNQCTGCFMTLSVGTLREIKASGEAITCDNCGRLLYTVD